MALNEKSRVASASVLAAVFLTGLKLVIGITTGSLGIISEAAHSGLDLIAAAMTFFAVKISAKPADETHHYGHGKIEGFSAFIEVILLLVTCGYIIYEAIERMAGKSAHVEVNVYSFAVMGISVVVDIFLSTALYRMARKHKSQALEADALHYSSDIWSAAVVIVGLVAYKYLNFPLADSVAALIVAVLVIIVSIRLAIRTIHVLLDRAPLENYQEMKDVIKQIPGIRNVDSFRIRSSGTKSFVDIRLSLAGELSFTEAHRVANTAESKISEMIPGADVIVHADPDEKQSKVQLQVGISDMLEEHESLFLSYHGLNIVRHEENYLVTMHLLMDGDSHIEEAHKVCDHLERDIKKLIPGAQVNIHIEPGRSS